MQKKNRRNIPASGSVDGTTGSLSGSIVYENSIVFYYTFQNEIVSENKFHIHSRSVEKKDFLPATGLLDDDAGSLSGSGIFKKKKLVILASLELQANG